MVIKKSSWPNQAYPNYLRELKSDLEGAMVTSSRPNRELIYSRATQRSLIIERQIKNLQGQSSLDKRWDAVFDDLSALQCLIFELL